MIKKKLLELFKIAILTILSLVLSLFSLYYSIGNLSRNMFYSYFDVPGIFLLNFVPILCTMLFIYFLFHKMSVSFLINSLIYISLTIINYFKLVLRNDPLVMEDLRYIKEALAMQQEYTFNFRKGMYITILFCLLTIIILYFIFDRKKWDKQKRKKMIIIKIIVCLVSIVLFPICLKRFYFSNEIYNKIANTSLINIWSDTHQYISRGFLYSFLHSGRNLNGSKPSNYNKSEAKSHLNSYSYTNITEDKKVNIIAIMLEAYNDFSKFNNIQFIKNPYSLLDEIKKISYSGELCTDIFAGGTVTTERSFITGFSHQSAFRNKTNSFAWYFQEQGYTVEGSHPGHEWFYNRQNINRNLGFSSYYFYEDKYSKLCDQGVTPDSILFEEILNLYNQHLYTGKPYFSFNVSYQNHGPYSTNKDYDESYIITKPNYTENEVNIFNNYLQGIEYTNEQLYKLINSCKEFSEPTVLIIFGDHNPWLGDSNSVYEMLGINLNLDTDEGFYNYYCTPYIIWANDAAKEKLGNDFVGQGPLISPCFLMSEFFELAGFTGNAYMQINTDLKHALNVFHISQRYAPNGTLTNTLDENTQAKVNKFINTEYYYLYNFNQ